MTLPAKPAVSGQPSLRLVAPDAGDAAPGGAGPAPLTPEHLRQLRDAEKRARKIRRAAGVASFGGWSAAIFAVLSAAFAIFDPTSLVAAGVLTIVAYHELKGRQQLLRFEAAAIKRLVFNQLFFGTLIVAYGAWMLSKGMSGTSALPAQASTGDPDLDRTVADLTKTATVAVYAGVIAIGVLVPGLTAIYYNSKARLLREFVEQTPAWVLDLMRTRV